MTRLGDADPSDLAQVNRLIVKLTDDFPALLGDDLAHGLRELRAEIGKAVPGLPAPQLAPRNVVRRGGGIYESSDAGFPAAMED